MHAKVEAALKCMKKRNLTFAYPCMNLPELSLVDCFRLLLWLW